MNKIYKIKVDITEFRVKEEDLVRIVEAMKSNDMVKLDCGIFRGSAIRAVYRDEDEEVQLALCSSKEKKPEQIEEERIINLKKEQKLNSDICHHTGMKIVNVNGEDVAKICDCQIIK